MRTTLPPVVVRGDRVALSAVGLVAALLLGACGGAESCPRNLSRCGSACVSLRSDAGNCGDCGVACTPPQVCADAACADACPTGQTLCDGGCFDLTTDPNACGSCGHACAADQYCLTGTCYAPPPSGSCPFVFLWDGERYRYDSDLSGSPLAAGLSFFRPVYYGLNVYELGDWAADDGVFRMRLRELLFEASYFDLAVLMVADVPEGYGVYNEWSSTPQLEREPSRRYVTVRNPRPPLSARVDGDVDVMGEVSVADGNPMPVDADGLSRVILDFGPLERPEQARLIVTTWGVYEDWQDVLSPPYSAGTTIETPDGAGGWVERVVAGKSASDARTWAIDLAGVLPAGDTRMRITLAHQPSTIDVLDAVLLDDSEQVPIRLTPVAPRIAELGFGGAGHVEVATLGHRTLAEDIARPVDPDALLDGNYTRYGDVGPLLGGADDRFAIMAQGDELYLEFDAPPQEPGTTRRVFLHADVFYTLKYHPFGVLTNTIEPLPFHGMESYPYPPEAWPYLDDADYARYLSDWNTRVIEGP
jgi:hypothetical protein